VTKQTEKEILLEVKDMVKYFPVRAGVFKRVVAHVKAVDGVNFNVFKGETFGLVGESGCGKTTAGMTLMRLYEATAGTANFKGYGDLLKLKGTALRNMRKDIQMIFQDPYSSLNPRMRVKNIIAEGIKTHHLAHGSEVDDRVARALAVNPDLIVCDEAVSALDVSIQAQVINLLNDIQEEFGLTYIFIAHDLAVVKHISDRIAVMYLGKIVEMTDKYSLFDNPLHPYTKALISAIPIPDPTHDKKRVILEGDVPSPINPPSGCRFHTRCPIAKDICSQEDPVFEEKADGHFAACHFVK
jgi:oligopeptide/dipeptide ABC transporter ATP-binding protein